MSETKILLIEKYGCYCMICKRHDIHVQWHHIVPKYYSKRIGYPPDNSVENGSLLCENCHRRIHKHDYTHSEYQKLIEVILEYKKRFG